MKILSGIWILLSLAVLAEDPQITTELANREAFLGDAVPFSIKITHEEGWQFEPVVLSDPLGDASILSQTWSEPARLETTDLYVAEMKAKLAWYRFGEFKTPAITIKAKAPDGSEQTFTTPELSIEIMNMLPEEDQELAPGKDQVAMQVPPLWPFILAGVLLLALIIGIVAYFLIFRKKDAPEKVVPLVPPYREAIDRLRELTHGSLLKEGQFKAFHVAINQIIRHYYHRLYHINAEEMTSFEVEDWIMSQKHLPEGFLDLNRDFQDLCDRVKYAKHDPLEAENKQVVNQAYQLVELLKPQEEEVGNVAVG